jgi:tRNA A64-2'-O-ribosylphosphate transferase
MSHALPASTPIGQLYRALKRDEVSFQSRLRSIDDDATYVDALWRTHYASLPRIPNLRCGAWYVTPSTDLPTACFKSGDGHYGQWRLALTRLNLHLLPLAKAHGY